MKAIKFNEANIELAPPANFTEHCEPMPAFGGVMYEDNPVPVVISCHEMSSDELVRVIETRRVYLSTIGAGRQPVLLTVENPVKEGWAR